MIDQDNTFQVTSNTSTKSNLSFVKKHKMDNVMKIFEDYLEANDENDEDEIDLEFHDEHHINDLRATNISTFNSRQVDFAEKVKLIDSCEMKCSEILQKFQKEGGDFSDEIVKTLMEMKEPKEVVAYLEQVRSKEHSIAKECLRTIFESIKSKDDHMLTEIKQSIQLNEEKFQRKLALIQANSAKPPSESYFTHFSALLNELKEADCKVNEAQKMLEVLKYSCKQVKNNICKI